MGDVRFRHVATVTGEFLRWKPYFRICSPVLGGMARALVIGTAGAARGDGNDGDLGTGNWELWERGTL